MLAFLCEWIVRVAVCEREIVGMEGDALATKQLSDQNCSGLTDDLL